MATKKAKKKTAKKAAKKAAPKKVAKKAAPILSTAQLMTLKSIAGSNAPVEPTRFDRRTLNSLSNRGFAKLTAKAVSVTKAGVAYLGGDVRALTVTRVAAETAEAA